MSSEILGDRPSDFSQPRPPDGAGYGAAPTVRPRRNGWAPPPWSSAWWPWSWSC
jgi:hypothetical protein